METSGYSEGEKILPRPAVLAVPQHSVPVPLNNTALPWNLLPIKF